MRHKNSRLPCNMAQINEHFACQDIEKYVDDVEKKARADFLFFYDRKHRTGAGCTRCKAMVEIAKEDIRRYKHNDWAECPVCGKKMMVKHIWRGISSLRQPIVSYHFSKSSIDPEIVTCMVLYTQFQYRSVAPWSERPFVAVDGCYVFVPGEGAVYAAPHYKVYADGVTAERGYVYDRDFSIRSLVNPRECVYHKQYSGEYTVDVWEDSMETMEQVMEGTPFQYVWAAFKDTIPTWILGQDHYIRLLDQMARYPMQLEKLAKIGFADTIYQAINERKGIWHIFNSRGKELDEITRGRISKQDKRYLLDGDKARIRCLEVWQKARHMPGGRMLSYRDVCENLSGTNPSQLSCLQYVNYWRLSKYLKRQHELHPDVRCDMGLYSDYLRNCVTLGDDMNSKATLWPKNLATAHANQKISISALQLKDEEVKYSKRLKALQKKYSYKAVGFAIIVPEHVADLVREGTEMHNCVGTYAKRVAEGKTNVVYIRKLDALEESFGTMEISNDGRIIQARGKYNRQLPEDAERFVEMFRLEKLEGRKAA